MPELWTFLLDAGFSKLAALDISAPAVEHFEASESTPYAGRGTGNAFVYLGRMPGSPTPSPYPLMAKIVARNARDGEEKIERLFDFALHKASVGAG